MPDKTLLIFLSLEALFIGSGVLLLAVAVVFNGKDVSGPLDIATNLLLNNCSLNGRFLPNLCGTLLTSYSCHCKCRPCLRHSAGCRTWGHQLKR